MHLRINSLTLVDSHLILMFHKMIPQILFSFAVAWVVYSAPTLAINYHRARGMNIPLVVVPVSPMNVLWIGFFEPLLFSIINRLPFRHGNFSRCGRRGWHFHDKAACHLQLGNAWAIVTPREILLYICNPEGINEFFERRQDFVRPIQFFSK